ncbi:MAG: hypothetical protein ACK5VI_09970 [Opitutia bacterium]
MLTILILIATHAAAFFAGAHNAKRANAFTVAAKQAAEKAKEAGRNLKK